MGNLREIAADPSKRTQVVGDACAAIDEEVRSKGGLGGMAIKTAYKMLTSLAPDMVTRTMDRLLDDFLDAVQPYYDEAKQKGQGVAAHIKAQSAQLTESLLSITDARAERAENGTMKKGYERLRPSAAKHVAAGVPRLADVIERNFP